MYETEACSTEVDTITEGGSTGTTSKYYCCVGTYSVLGSDWTGEYQSCTRIYLAINISAGDEGTSHMASPSLRLSVRTSLASNNGSQESCKKQRNSRLPQGRPYPKSISIKARVYRLPQVPILRARRPDFSRCREYC